jgi:hypothetical protein
MRKLTIIGCIARAGIVLALLLLPVDAYDWGWSFECRFHIIATAGVTFIAISARYGPDATFGSAIGAGFGASGRMFTPPSPLERVDG